MEKMSAVLILMCLFVHTGATKDWALLFTGFKGFENYASHAALCAAYHTLHAAGIPDERVVVIMYDDVANSPKNRYYGKLFNNYTRIDVYKGTPIDYSGKEISGDLILAVLKGDKDKVKSLIGREGKVIDSGPDDNIFVGAISAGWKEHILTPDGSISAKLIVQTLQDMHDNKKYAKLVFYLDSSFSGSMFRYLPDDINVYALTATGRHQYAFMNYCEDPELKWEGVCLGSQFINGWVENTQHINISSFTLEDQSKAIKKAVNWSKPHIFGDQTFLKLPLQQFFGKSPSHQQLPENKFDFKQLLGVHPHHSSSMDGAVPYHLMYYTLLKRRLEKSPFDKSLQDKMARLQAMMAQVDEFFYQTARLASADATIEGVDRMTSSPDEPIKNRDCYEAANDAVFTSCPGLVRREETQGYALSKFSVLVNLCNKLNGPQVLQALTVTSQRASICKLS